MARKSALMARSSYRARPGAGGGAGSVLLVFIVIAAIAGGVVWYFYAGGPGSKGQGPITGYNPQSPPTISVNVPRV